MYSENLNFLLKNLEFNDGDFDFAILNAKGFGGNNGTALIASPNKTMKMLEVKHSTETIKKYYPKNEKIQKKLEVEKINILSGEIKSRYMFGEDVINGLTDFQIEKDQIVNKVTNEKFRLDSTLPYKDFL